MSWTCPKCTFYNDKDICEMCETPKPEISEQKTKIEDDLLNKMLEYGFNKEDVYFMNVINKY